MGRFQRSITLIKASFRVLKKDKSLIILPLFSFLAIALLAFSFGLPLLLANFAGSFGGENTSSALQIVNYAVGFCFYLCVYMVIIFFNAAIIACADKLLKGEQVSLGYGIKIALSRFGLIFKWALIAATVGLILHAIEEKLGKVGQIIVGLIGLGWAVVSILVLPILVFEKKGPVVAVKESAIMLKTTWGENLLGFGGIGLVFMLIYLLIFGIGALGGHVWFTYEQTTLGVLLIGIASLLFVIACLSHTTLTTIFRVVLYQFAKTGEGNADFSAELLEGSVVRRKNRAF
jgi:hypothetical protein